MANSERRWIVPVFLLIPLLLYAQLLPASAGANETRDQGISRKKQLERLNGNHRRWFNMVEGLATRDEQKVFLQLENDRDRTIFIHSFWMQRDPTPGTEANETRDEIERRFQHVLSHFKRGSSRPPWQTDMGRFYMILGEPSGITRIESGPNLCPIQIWHYSGGDGLDLPGSFRIMFYRPHGTPQWEHYNPALHNPGALFLFQDMTLHSSQETLYKALFDISPDLAAASASPSLADTSLLGAIFDAPRKKINSEYARTFMSYKGYIDVETSTNYIESAHATAVLRNSRLGIDFVSIALKPNSFSVDFNPEKNRYHFNHEMSVSLKKGDRFVFEQKRNFVFHLTGEEVEKLKSTGIILCETVPVIPGEYTLLVFTRNSAGKEFSFFEENVTVPPSQGRPFLMPPLVSSRLEELEPEELVPFQAGSRHIIIDPEWVFSETEKPFLLAVVRRISPSLWSQGILSLAIQEIGGHAPQVPVVDIPLNCEPYRQDIHYIIPMAKEGLRLGRHRVTVRLLDENQNLLDSQDREFETVPPREVPAPLAVFRKTKIASPSALFTILGEQYRNIDKPALAAESFEQALSAGPGSNAVLIRWLQTLNLMGRFSQVLKESERLKKDPSTRFDYHLIRGNALFGLKEYHAALDELRSAAAIDKSDIRVLNLLGMTLAGIGRIEESLEALEESLAIDPRQPKIQKIVVEMKERAPGADFLQTN